MNKFGKYEILEKIGTGGFGVVFKGRDPFIKRAVAIKTCTSEDEDIRKRFFREAEIAGNLEHRNVTTVFDFGFEEGVPYLVQEYLTGEDLAQKIRRRDLLTLDQQLDLLLQVADGLEYAHDHGVVHRDIKPGNIRVLEDGRVKIMDFGIARLAHAESQLTQTGITVGTAAYLPPEQIRGSKVDLRADIFSFGIVAYELFTFERPFGGETISSLLYQILNENPKPLTDWWPACPPRLEALVERCLEKNADDRFSGFGEIAAELRAIKAQIADTGEEAVATKSMPNQTATRRTEERAALKELEAKAREALGAGNYTAAELEVTLAGKRYGASPAYRATFDPLLQEIAQARRKREDERRRGEKLTALIERARGLQKPGAFGEARLALVAALDLDPDNVEALALLRVTEESFARDQQQARRAAEVARVAGEVEAHLDRGNLDAAAKALLAVTAGAPPQSSTAATAPSAGAPSDIEPLATLKRRLDAALSQRAAAELAARVAVPLEEGKRLLAGGAFEGAANQAREALEIDPRNREARDLAERAGEELRRRQTEQERARQLAADVAAIEGDLGRSDAGSLARAEQGLTALERAGDPRSIAAAAPLRERLRERRQEEERAAAERREREMREAAERARAAAVAKAVGEIEKLLEAGKLEKAQARLDRAANELGSRTDLTAVEKRLNAAVRERELDAARSEQERAAQAQAVAAANEARAAAKAKEKAEAQAAAQAAAAAATSEAAARAEAKAAAKAEQQEKARAEAQAKAQAKTEAQAQAHTRLEAQAKAEAKAQAQAKAKAEAAARDREQAKARTDAHAREQAQSQAAVTTAVLSTDQVPAGRLGRNIAIGAGAVVVLGFGAWLATRGGASTAAKPDPTTLATTTLVPSPASPPADVAPRPSTQPSSSPPIQTPAPTETSPVSPPQGVLPPAAPDPRLEKVANFLRTARAQRQSDPPSSLLAASSAFDLMPSNVEARAMLEDLQGDARQRLANARIQAEKARGEELASATMFAASGRVREADQANSSGKLAAAVRALWASSELYALATQQASQRAALPPTTKPTTVASNGTLPGTSPGSSPGSPQITPPKPTEVTPPISTNPPTTEPTAPQAPPAPSDSEVILATLHRYAAAMGRLSAGAVLEVWPSTDGAKLGRALGDFNSLQMTIGGCKITPAGDVATAVCNVHQVVQPRAGKAIDSSLAATFRLRRAGEGWVIEGRS